jgi:hypothetical protein
MLPRSVQSHVSVLRGLFLVLPALVLLGCGGSGEAPLPPLAPVKGTVTVDGKKLTSGQVSLVAELPADKVPPSSGKIDSQGNYEIFTGGKSGAPLGKFKVGVTPDMSKPMEKGQEGPPKNYQDPAKSKLVLDVIEGPLPGRYDLKLTSK